MGGFICPLCCIQEALNLYVEEEFHRASRGGAGGVKSITNYAPVSDCFSSTSNYRRNWMISYSIGMVTVELWFCFSHVSWKQISLNEGFFVSYSIADCFLLFVGSKSNNKSKSWGIFWCSVPRFVEQEKSGRSLFLQHFPCEGGLNFLFGSNFCFMFSDTLACLDWLEGWQRRHPWWP